MKNNKCHLYRINGVEDHLHIVAHLHPTVALAGLVKDIKIASNKYIIETELFPGFPGWQTGYSAFTYSINEKQQLIEYVKNQEAHHKNMSYREELQMLLKKHGIDYDEKYLL
jgi:REP element-mobilizing transposase RayT